MISERRLLRAEPDFGLLTKLWRINWLFVMLLCLLAGCGYVALYSAGGGPEPYAWRHALRFGFALVMMLSISMVDIRFIARFSWPLYGVALVLLILVLKMGHVGKGAERWLELGPVQLQPSELMKVALAMALAAWFNRASWARVGNPLFLLPPAILVAAPVLLILKEPNLGTAFITAMVGASIFVGAGMRLWQMALLALPLPFLAEFAYKHLHDYQRARITTFLNPESDPLGAGYNIIQSKIALGSGGLWGKGFMQGTQAHLNFLPEKQTDFIFSIIAEEWGLVGALALLGLLLTIILAGMMIALRCRNQYGRLLALGMVVGAIPVGGVPLPLVSHGGSAMLTVMFAMGLLMSVHVHRDVEFPGKRDFLDD
jgi:rod shape determining protein RodA